MPVYRECRGGSPPPIVRSSAHSLTTRSYGQALPVRRDYRTTRTEAPHTHRDARAIIPRGSTAWYTQIMA